MIDWNYWIGKKVFVQLKHGAVYSGVIQSVDNLKNTIDTYFITILDKFNKVVIFTNEEIVKLVEEKEDDMPKM